jgi:hypothetical protein
MVNLYVLLGRDEERRMVSQFGDQYRAYMARTGRFVPRSWERATLPRPRSPILRGVLGGATLVAAAIGSAFALRAYTVAHFAALVERPGSGVSDPAR